MKKLTEKYSLLDGVPDHLKNIRTLTVLEKLIENIQYIPIEELEKLVSKYEL